MRKILSIGISLSMLVMTLCCFSLLPASAENEARTNTLHTFSAENADYWTLQQGMTRENADDGLTFNNAGDYGYTQNVDNFAAKQYLTVDGARANVTDYSNIAQGIRLYVKNNGPAVDTFVIIQVAMGPKFKSTVNIPAGEGIQQVNIPMSSFTINESSNETYPVDTTWEAFLESKPAEQDWFDIYLMGFNFVSTDHSVSVTFQKIETYEIVDGGEDGGETGGEDGGEDGDDNDGETGETVKYTESAMYTFDKITNWTALQGAEIAMENGEFVMKNTGGAYGDIKNGGVGSDFYPHIKLTTDNKAWDGKNGIDGVRLYIKNPGNAMPLQIIFTTENGTKWILRQDIAGGSEEYVPYDFALGDFHKATLEGEQRKNLTLEELDFSIWDIEINMVSAIPEDTLYFSKMTKLMIAADGDDGDDDVDNKPTGVAGVGVAVFALAGLSGAALVLSAKKGKKSR